MNYYVQCAEAVELMARSEKKINKAAYSGEKWNMSSRIWKTKDNTPSS